MAGRIGRNRAWNKLPVEVHVQRGTYRADRHGPWPLQSTPAAPAWEPSAADLAGLEEAGRLWLTEQHARCESTLMQGLLLVQAAHVVDSLATYQPLAASGDKPATRLVVSLTKTLAALLAQIRVS